MSNPILFTIPNFITAGSGRAMLNIVERLDRAKFLPAVCVSRMGGKLDKEVEALGIPFIESNFTIPPKPYATLLWRARQAAHIFRPYRFALWHSFHYSDDYTEALIARFAGAQWLYSKKNMGWGSRAWKLRSLLATRIVTLNSEMADLFFSSPLLRKKHYLNPCGVDIQAFSPNAAPRLNLRAQQGLSVEMPVIVVVAHLIPVKGHPTLLKALTKIPNAHVWLAGQPMDAKYSAALHAQAEYLQITDRVHFLGDIADIPALLAEADIVALPTRMDALGVAILEAMACGKACVASDVEGPRELLVHQQNGLLVPSEDVDALAGALNRLIENPALRARYGMSARRRVEERFTIEREVAQHEALYLEMLGRG